MPTYLDELLADARARVATARVQESAPALRSRAEAAPPPPGFRRALTRPGVAVIAEVKRASPSRGELAPGLQAVDQAREYVAGGADAISVLTEPERFKGSLADLEEVATLGTPCLRKDFIIDPSQVWEARAAGAAAVLLIVAALDDALLQLLSAEAATAGLDALVEVHDQHELRRALAAGAEIVGVNARDLRTFEIDRDTFTRLRPEIPEGVLAIAESGIRGPDDVRAAARAGADAVLVGEALVTTPDPAATVATLVAAGDPATLEGTT